MKNIFEIDPYPGKARILFVGHPLSTHVYSWIDLVANSPINVRFFAIPFEAPPMDWPIRTYLSSESPPRGLDVDTRKCLHPAPEREEPGPAGVYFERAILPEEWLSQIIVYWHPHIIHVFGIDPASFFFRKALRDFKLRDHFGRWVVQIRGGSDLTLSRHNPETASLISNTLNECDQIITDNKKNFEYLQEIGVPIAKVAEIAPVPGTGGIDIEELADSRNTPPSKRGRVILWPKAYECPWSKGLPVLEAVETAWEHLRPCKIYMLAAEPEVRQWFYGIPEEIRKSCEIDERVPRARVMELMRQARVMLAPSLVDGVPNSMYEAMACGAFPIVSPLDTIATVVRNEENALFARNLYPSEIAAALVRAMNDDRMVDRAACNNLEVLRAHADRSLIRCRIVDYYERLAKSTCREGRKGAKEKLPLVSIITLARNHAPFLDETIQSVLSQDYPNLEYIVLDDGSEDNTREVLAKYGDRLYWESHASMGESRTINKGFRLAKCDIACVVKADAPLLQGAVDRAVHLMVERPELVAVYSDYYLLPDDSGILRLFETAEYDYLTMLAHPRRIVGPGAFIRMKAIDAAGGIDDRLKHGQDIDFWFRLGLQGSFARVSEAAATLRLRPGSGAFFSNEGKTAKRDIGIIRRFFSLPSLPHEIKQTRWRTLSAAHLNASRLAGRAYFSRLIHYTKYMLYCPKNVIADRKNICSALSFLVKQRIGRSFFLT